MAGQKQDDQLEHTFSSYVRIRDVALKTYQRRWTIGRSGERGSGISVLAARHDDDDDDDFKAKIDKTNNIASVGSVVIETKRSIIIINKCSKLAQKDLTQLGEEGHPLGIVQEI